MTDDSYQHFPEIKIVPQMLSNTAHFWKYIAHTWKIHYINVLSDSKTNFYIYFLNC